jgi:hypothetical protein
MSENKKDGFLKRSFESVARPIRALNKNTFGLLRLTASYLFMPARIRDILAILVVSQAATPLSGYMFPTAEEYLESHDIDPSIAAELSDVEVRVRERDALGYTHSLLELPTFLAIGLKTNMLDTDYQAYATRGIPLFGYSGYELLNQCHTTMPGKDTTVEGWISAMTGIPASHQKEFDITEKEIFITIAFHEFRHCSTDNDQGIPMTEGDSDYFALKKAVEAFDNEELIPFFIHLRSMAFQDVHNTSLYLDYKYRGLRVPSEDLIIHANREAHEYAKIYLPEFDETQYRPSYLQYRRAFLQVLENHRHEMSALAARRAELFIEATNYFTPYFSQPNFTKDSKQEIKQSSNLKLSI